MARSGGNSKGRAKRLPRGKAFSGADDPRRNKKGRPPKDFDLVTRCRELTPDIIERYALLGKRAKTSAEVAAGKIVIEYGFDKPKQRTELTGPNGTSLTGPAVTLYLPDDGSRPDAPLSPGVTTTTLDVSIEEDRPAPTPADSDAGDGGA